MHNHRKIRKNHHPVLKKNNTASSVEILSSPLWLTLPSDLWHPVKDKKISTSIISAGSKANETKIMSTLSQTCKSFYALFQPELDKRAAKQLLEYVLQGNEEKVRKIAKTNPKLFFIKSTTHDYAMDLEGHQRTIKDWSPYQAMFGTGDKVMLQAVKAYLDAYLETQDHGYELAAQQEQEKFPDGFDYPPCTDAFKQVMNALIIAITNDKQLRQEGIPTKETLSMLEKFRKYYTPSIVEIGHHFNMSELLTTYSIYERQILFHSSNQWNINQHGFFGINVIGFQQRFMTAPYLQASCMGFKKYYNADYPMRRSFKVTSDLAPKIIKIAPFINENPTHRLGEHLLINIIDGSWSCVRLRIASPMLSTLCQENTADLAKLTHKSKIQSVVSYMHQYLKKIVSTPIF